MENEVLEKNNIFSPVFSYRNKAVRILWGIFYYILFRFSPTPMFNYRVLLLKAFGAEVEFGSRIYPSSKIWLPSNLVVKRGATIGAGVNIYNQGRVSIHNNCIISQGAHICASTHDYNDPLHPLVLAPILIERNVWICADAFIGPGVTVSEGSVIGARAAVFKDTEEWQVYSGNPAVYIKSRERF